MPTAINHGTNNDQNIIVQVDYDKGGRMVAMRDPNGQETTYEYDQLGRRTKLTNPLNQEWTTSYAETANGTQTTMNYPEANHSVTRDFDLLGRLTGIQYGNRATTPDVDFTYDTAGNRTKMIETSEVGGNPFTARETTYSYDNARRLTSVGFDEDGNGVVDETVAYDYDISGRRTSLTFDGQTIGYEYDERGRLITLTDWDTGRSTFSYDGAGRHIATQRPNGMRSSYRHDHAGRLARLQHHKGLSKLAQFDYTVDSRGNRTQVIEMLRPANANYATRTFAYNHANINYKGSWVDTGQFKATDDWADSLALTVTGDELTLTYGTGPDHSIFDIYVGGTFYNSYDGYAASTGEETMTIQLDSDQRISFEIKNRHEQNLASSGFRVRFKNLQAKSKLTTQVIDYTYDNLSRLQTANYNSGERVYDFDFDLAGNRLQEALSGTGVTDKTTNYEYNNANQITRMNVDGGSWTNLTYDNNGNLTNDGTNSYTWDRANRMATLNDGVDTYSYAYDGMGRRVSQTVNSTVTQYLLDTQPSLAKVLAQTTGANTERFIHAPRGIHAMEDNTGTWSYMAQDGLGSVRAEIDASAVVSASQNYAPYGQPMDVSGSFDSSFGFTGEQTDGNSQVYLRARYYNPSIGVFSALDAFEGAMQNPMSLNGYSWVEGNVPNAVDPSGNCPVCAVVIIAGVLLTSCSGGGEPATPQPTPGVTFITPTPYNPDNATATACAMNGGMCTATATATSTPTNTPTSTPTSTFTPTPTATSTPAPFGTPISGIYHVDCSLTATLNIRREPSVLAPIVASIPNPAGTQFQASSFYPDTTLGGTGWYFVNGASSGWVYDSSLVQGNPTCQANSFPIVPTPVPTLPPNPNDLGNISKVISCEAAGEAASMAGIAHTIYNRMQSSQWSQTAMGVIQTSGVDCWTNNRYQTYPTTNESNAAAGWLVGTGGQPNVNPNIDAAAYYWLGVRSDLSLEDVYSEIVDNPSIYVYSQCGANEDRETRINRLRSRFVAIDPAQGDLTTIYFSRNPLCEQ